MGGHHRLERTQGHAAGSSEHLGIVAPMLGLRPPYAASSSDVVNMSRPDDTEMTGENSPQVLEHLPAPPAQETCCGAAYMPPQREQLSYLLK